MGLLGVGGIAVSCSAFASADVSVDEVWGWDNGDPSSFPSIYKGDYFPADRQPDTRDTSNAEPLSWFVQNHPDWLEFRCAASSLSESEAIANGDLAYEFGQTTVIPLDTSNGAVLAWLEQNFWGPAAASGKFQHLDFDNFQMINGGKSSGARCGHYSSTGSWVSQYNGTKADPNYRAAEIALAQHIQTWLHTNYPKVAFAANLSWLDANLSDQLGLLSHVDLWLDEQGFTNGNNGAGGYADSAWKDKVAAVKAVISAGHGWQDINQEPVSFDDTTRAQRQWALGNYLLLKNNASWIYISGEGEYGTLLIAPEYQAAQVGTPTDSYYQDHGVYRRDFTTGLVFVNPSSTTSHTVTLPNGTYKDLYGNVEPSRITIEPQDAVVLVTA